MNKGVWDRGLEWKLRVHIVLHCRFRTDSMT
jgi:hypothetical protein